MLALGAGCWLSPAWAQSADELADLFVRIAGRPEYSRTGTSGVHKWRKTVRYVVIGDTQGSLGARIDGHMGLMRTLTGLAIERVSPEGGLDAAARVIARGPGRFHVSAPATANDDAARTPVVTFTNPAGSIRWRGNFFIFVGNRVEIVSLTRGFGAENPNLARRIESGAVACTAILHFAAAERAIATAFVFIRTDMGSAMIERCVEEEVTQSFGLMSDVRGSRLTLFDDDIRQGKTRLTEIDKLLLRALYDPRIQPGMAGPALRRAAREVLSSLRPH